jgi:hypothetical protein
MGCFYVNITTRKAQSHEVIDFLKSNNLSAYIIVGPEDFCSIYEQICDTQNMNHISAILCELSRHFSCPAIGVMNHDNDILAYELWLNGEKVDEYDSCPDCFDPEPGGNVEPIGGNAKLLSELMGQNPNEKSIEDVLRAFGGGDLDFVFAVERHGALAKAVGLPSHTVGYGFNYLSEGVIPEGISKEDILETEG